MRRKGCERKQITGFRGEHQDEDDRRRKSLVLKRLVMSGIKDWGMEEEMRVAHCVRRLPSSRISSFSSRTKKTSLILPTPLPLIGLTSHSPAKEHVSSDLSSHASRADQRVTQIPCSECNDDISFPTTSFFTLCSVSSHQRT